MVTQLGYQTLKICMRVFGCFDRSRLIYPLLLPLISLLCPFLTVYFLAILVYRNSTALGVRNYTVSRTSLQYIGQLNQHFTLKYSSTLGTYCTTYNPATSYILHPGIQIQRFIFGEDEETALFATAPCTLHRAPCTGDQRSNTDVLHRTYHIDNCKLFHEKEDCSWSCIFGIDRIVYVK
jgi:hypothetical protein